MKPSQWGPVAVAVVALSIGSLLAVRLLAESDWDPTLFASFGEKSTAILEYAEEKLGREVLTRPEQGHDGRLFFVQANDPWLLDPEENAIVLDRAVYRSQRMLYPVLASAGGLLSADAIIWALIVVNVLMLGVGSWAIASIAVHHGLPAWVGLAFALNVGLMFGLAIDGAGVTAFALACLGAYALEKESPDLAGLAFVGAVLAREVMALFVAAVAVIWLLKRKSFPWRFTVPPAAALIAWAIFIRLRITFEQDVDQVRELTLVPFSGVAKALSSGLAETVDYLVILMMLGLLVLIPLRAWRSRLYVTWGAVGFAVLGPFLTIFVWQKSFDITRALAPLMTVFILEFVMARRKTVVKQPIRT